MQIWSSYRGLFWHISLFAIRWFSACPLRDPMVLALYPHPCVSASWSACPLHVFKLSRIVLEFFCILKVLLDRNVTKKRGTSLQRRAFSSIDIFESLLKGKFAMELLCKSEVVIEDCFGTFHSSRSGGSLHVLFAIRWSWHLTPIPACLLSDPLVLRMFSRYWGLFWNSSAFWRCS